MKRAMRIAASMLAAAGLFGLTFSSAMADASREEGTPPSQEQFWEHMNEMRTIMHEAVLKDEKVEKGVRIEATGSEAEVIAAIKEEFGSGRHALQPPFPNSEVSATLIENGVVLSYTSNDPETVKQLQYYGTGLFYGLVRNNMHELMAAGQPGFRGGPYGGQPCIEGGPYAGRMGPGMMGAGQGRGPGGGPGWHHGRGGPNGPGYGRGGMMGPGYGPGYGRGGMMGPGYGAQQEEPKD